MTGRWLLKSGTHTQFTFSMGDIFYTKKVKLVYTENRIHFDDARTLGKVEICFSKKELITRLQSQGPDFMLAALSHFGREIVVNEFQEALTLQKWLDIMGNNRIKNKEIMDFIKESTRVSGVGNYLRAEILYQCKISPHRSLCSLSKDEKIAIYYASLDVIYKSFTLGGHSIKDYLTPDGNMGNFKPIVYGKLKDAFGNKIVGEKKKGKQTMYWVPEIQL